MRGNHTPLIAPRSKNDDYSVDTKSLTSVAGQLEIDPSEVRRIVRDARALRTGD